jgi:hypothetical protein
LNLLKRLPNDEKYNPKGRFAKDSVFLPKSEVKMNRTGMKQTRLSVEREGRITTAQTHKSSSRTGTRQGRTRAQIIAEFFCFQNWNYFAKKALMLKKEREGTKECIVKYRRFKRGLRRFWVVYKRWIQKVKLQRETQRENEEENKTQEIEKEEDEQQQEKQEEAVNNELDNFDEEQLERLRKCQPDEIQNIEEVKKCEFMLNEDNDIFTLNEGVDLSKFKESAKLSKLEYDKKITEIKEAKKEIKAISKIRKLDNIPEEVDESVTLSPFHLKAGKVLAAKIEIAWKLKMNRKEAKKLRQMLKNLPPQCRNSYVKLMQLRSETAELQNDLIRMPVRR